MMCEALGVSRSGFYAWLTRPRSQRDLADEVLGGQVRQSFMGSDRTYGARRVWHDMLAFGHRCGLHRIERLMRAQALRARPGAVVLLGVRGERPQLLFARADDVALDAGALLRTAAAAGGGRGGGRPDFAQGGVPTNAGLDAALQAALHALPKD